MALRPVTAEALFASQASPCYICCGQGNNGTCFSQDILVFPCHSHSIDDPFSHFLHLTPKLYDIDKWQRC